MSVEKNDAGPGKENFPPAGTGNASNPSPRDVESEPAGTNQVLGEKAEKYLRESASIEDLPDAQDEQDAADTIRRQSGNDKG